MQRAVTLLDRDDLGVVLSTEVALAKRLADRIDGDEQTLDVGMLRRQAHDELVEPDMLLFATLGDLSVVVRAKAEEAELTPGAQVHLAFPAERLHFFDPENGARLP